MSRYECTICGYVYDEAVGIPEAGIAPGTLREDLPDDWECPLCGAAKSDFELIEESPVGAPAGQGEVPGAAAAAPAPAAETAGSAGTDVRAESAEGAEAAVAAEADHDDDLQQMSWGELAATFSNLARGCEKQYLAREQQLFGELAAYFTGRAQAQAKPADAEQLVAQVKADIDRNHPRAEAAAKAAADRGAQRALVWSGKVERIVGTLLERYRKEGSAFLDGANVYVCTICGFVYVGENPPELCPICKVPSWKFQKIEGGRA